ncbi:MAG: type II secretion system protein [Erysipelotrichaceae bacterium]|nr:type II secretion system protein [Erysipelotrichaceae bacterium]
MSKKTEKNRQGFSLAELMVVVAIIGILAGVGFVAVIRYMRILKQMQYDAVAKEIFIAAQNHLSMAYNEGYLETEKTGFGTADSNESGAYYFVVQRDIDSQSDTLLDLMLPFGSIESGAREGGSYIVRYHPESGQILDVFYSDMGDEKYGFTFNGSDLYKNPNGLMSLRDEDSKPIRRNYPDEDKERVIGYYGSLSAGTILTGAEIPVPYIRVDNAEELLVNVRIEGADLETSEKASLQLKLVIVGEVSGAEGYVSLKKNNGVFKDTYSYCLDSITQKEMHFSDILELFTYKDTKKFIPGENLTVYVEAFDNSRLTNITRTAKIKTNSLFGDASTVNNNNETENIADISNIRHLENLHDDISSLDLDATKLERAEQSNDLDWDIFLDKTNKSNTIVYKNDATGATLKGCYCPVDLPVDYNGENYQISNINVNYSGPAGLFGKVAKKPDDTKKREIKNLMLVDFTIIGSDAGALVGQISDSSVENVIVIDSGLYRGSDGKYKYTEYVSGTDSVGGLIGYCSNTKVDFSAAAVIVKNGQYSGGLIGSAVGNSEISNSYAAGHTIDGKFNDAPINVTGTDEVGGLIGHSQGATISNSYATCSVSGAIAGGLIGSYSGSAISNSYAAAYVSYANKEENHGAFIGNDSSPSVHSNCYYLIAPNDTELPAIGNKNSSTVIKAIDKSTTSYRNFIKLTTAAAPYDGTLKRNFNGQYLYQSIKELSGKNTSNKFVDKHNGDWPDYQIQIINKKTNEGDGNE